MADIKELLEKIHAKLAEDMLDLLNSGNAEAKDWAVIVKFLKDNNIDAIPSNADSNSAFDKLVEQAKNSINQYQ